MVNAITQGIEVSAESFFLEEQSNPRRDHYAFAYRIRLKNHSPRTVQLLSRRWVITDSNGRVNHVEGDGVVGKQPVLGPGDDYEYMSGSRLESPMGTMHGAYRMRDEAGESFEVEIPVFTLSANASLN